MCNIPEREDTLRCEFVPLLGKTKRTRTRAEDNELLSLFRSVEKLSNEDKNFIKTMIDALVTKRHVQQLAH
jgi:hypothetical protein